jgi:hypothetical protein
MIPLKIKEKGEWEPLKKRGEFWARSRDSFPFPAAFPLKMEPASSMLLQGLVTPRGGYQPFTTKLEGFFFAGKGAASLISPASLIIAVSAVSAAPLTALTAMTRLTGLTTLTAPEVEKKKGVHSFTKIHSPGYRDDGRAKMGKDSLERKVIQKKILLGSHLGHWKSKNLLYPIHSVKRRGEMESSLAGIRGDLFVFRPLSSQRYILKTLLFLLELLETGGRVLVVDTGDRALSLLSWRHPAEVEPFLSSQEERKLVSKTPFQKGCSARGCFADRLSVQLERDFLPQKEFAWSGEKWFGGALTNWEEISKKIYQFGTLLKEIPSDTVSLSSRFEKWMRGFPGFLSALSAKQLLHQRCNPLPPGVSSPQNNRSANQPLVEQPRYGAVNGAWKLTKEGGIPTEIRLRLGKKVDGILLINPNDNRDVIAEARLRKIPVIGFADSSTNLSGVDLSIPINLSSIGETFIFLSILFEIGRRLSVGSKSGRGLKKKGERLHFQCGRT